MSNKIMALELQFWPSSQEGYYAYDLTKISEVDITDFARNWKKSLIQEHNLSDGSLYLAFIVITVATDSNDGIYREVQKLVLKLKV